MPLVKIHLRKGKSREYLRDVSEAIHAALVSQASVPPDDRFQIVFEHDAGSFIAHPSYGGVSRSEDLIVIEITLNTGRTLETKKNLYADIVRRLQEAADIRPDDVLISLTEVAKENWSFGKGLCTYG
ncbi:MAG TPA: tautomerase family protein [Thermoanaerobaculia bacterium]|nr:tautomerase family protein [Thermoanaerobaculia bacterium]